MSALARVSPPPAGGLRDALAAQVIAAAAEGLAAARAGERFKAISAAIALEEAACLPRPDLAPLARRSAAEIRAALGHVRPRPESAAAVIARSVRRAMAPLAARAEPIGLARTLRGERPWEAAHAL